MNMTQLSNGFDRYVNKWVVFVGALVPTLVTHWIYYVNPGNLCNQSNECLQRITDISAPVQNVMTPLAIVVFIMLFMPKMVFQKWVRFMLVWLVFTAILVGSSSRDVYSGILGGSSPMHDAANVMTFFLYLISAGFVIWGIKRYFSAQK